MTPPDMLVDDGFGGRWSANGNEIVFAAHPTADNRNALYAVRSDGSDLHQLPIPDCGEAFSDPNSVGCPEADWSPDGQHLVYTHRTAAGQNVRTVDLAAGIAKQLSPPGETQDGFPSWGPPLRQNQPNSGEN